jgi:hypothetical protein
VSITVQKYQGAGGIFAQASGVGAVFTGVAVAAIFVNERAALFSYLVAFTFWAGVALASLILLMIFHAFRAKWMVVLRRPLEVMAATLPLFLVLALPILINIDDIYSWMKPDQFFEGHELQQVRDKRIYLNPAGFILRTIGYFAVAGFVAWRLFAWSTQQDSSGDPALTQKQRNLGTGALPLVAMVITFASFDWLMSLNPTWYSTIFGVYYFAGSFWSTVAILIILVTVARGRDPFADHVGVEHIHNLGNLLFAFTCFWGYIGFSQMMLIWIANLPEEIPFYAVRMQGDWAAVGIVLIIGHFVLPFSFLLSRDLKRTPTRLSLVAGWALLMNLLDLFWLVMPTLNPQRVTPHWSLLFAFVGLGGLTAAFGLWKLRGHYTTPPRDPFLDVSLRYRQPV